MCKTKVAVIGIFIIFLFLLNSEMFAQTQHPRIFLNDEIIGKLKNRMVANTREWQSFHSYLETYMVEQPWGGQYIDGIAAFALGYLLTDSNAYADRALEFLDQWVNELNNTSPFYVSGDDYAHIYEAVGLGFDWLYNYPGFSDSQKQSIMEMMNRAYEYGQKPWDQDGGDFEADPHDSDQFIGGAKTALIWGTATLGDNPSAEAMINRSRELWDNNIIQWIRKSIGGVWPEGSQYSYNTLYFLLAFTEAERTANGKNYWTESPEITEFIPNSIKTQLWLTPPSNDHILTYCDQEDENAHYWDRRNHFTAIATFIADNLGYADEAAYGRFWIREISPDNIEMNLWKLFLWYDPDKTHTNYFNEELPLACFADGTDWMFLRSNWTSQCTYSTFSAMWTNVDHQFTDGGHFNIWRNGEYLTRQVRHYDFNFSIDGKIQTFDGETANIMLIQSDYESDDRINAMGSPEYFESAGEPEITRHKISTSPLYAYSFAELGNSYNRIYDEWDGNSDRVKSYTRQFVQIAADIFIVYDRVRTTDPGWTKYILHSLTEPAITGNIVTQTSESGAQKLFNRTLSPESVTITKINEAEVWNSANGLLEDWMLPESERKWHVRIQPENSDSVNMLNVIEICDDDNRIVNAELITCQNGIGTRIGNWLVLFSAKEGINKSVSYRIASDNGPVSNLICDLEPEKSYAIQLDGNLLQIIKAGAEGTVYFTVDRSDSANITIEQTTTSVSEKSHPIPEFRLWDNFPNPFNPSTTIGFTIGEKERVLIKLYDIRGREVRTMIDQVLPAGSHAFQLKGENLATGVYIYKMQAGQFVQFKKMLLVR